MSGCCDGDGTLIPGPQGPQGDSAYQVWLDEGNVGTEQDYLDSLQGVPGPNGATGPIGAVGIQGIQGLTGATGGDGADGLAYLTGAGNPSPSTGVDGDTYSNNINGEIWIKSAGVWTFTGYTLKGVQGAQGSIGLTGATGASGTNGTDGADGDDGLGYDDTTSTDSTDIIDTVDTTINMTWTVGKAFIAGSRVRVADSTNPSANYFEGVVNSYDDTSGSASVEAIDKKEGTGTLSSWNISITGDVGGAASTASLAATLLIGDTTGASDINVNAGQNVRYESPAIADANIVGAEFYDNTFATKIGQVGFRTDNDEVELNGDTKDVRIVGQNTIVESPTDKAMVLPVSNNPTADVTAPIDGMIKYRSQGGSEDVEAYINGAWVSLTGSGADFSIITANYTQTGKRTQELAGFTQTFQNGRFALESCILNYSASSKGNTSTSVTITAATDLNNFYEMIATDDFTLDFAGGVSAIRGFYFVKVTQDATGGRVMTLGTNAVSTDGNPIMLNSGANEVTIVKCWCDGSNFYLESSYSGDFNIIEDDMTQTANRTQTLGGFTQNFYQGRFHLQDTLFTANRVAVSSAGGALVIDLDGSNNYYSMTTTENFTLSFSNIAALRVVEFKIVITRGASAYTMTTGAPIGWEGGTAGTLSTGVGEVDVLTGWTDGSGVYLELKKNWS